MPQYLSQEWLDETRALAESQPERSGASAQLQYVVRFESSRGGNYQAR